MWQWDDHMRALEEPGGFRIVTTSSLSQMYLQINKVKMKLPRFRFTYLQVAAGSGLRGRGNIPGLKKGTRLTKKSINFVL